MHGTTLNPSATVSLQPIMKATPVQWNPPITELAMTSMAVEAATNRGGGKTLRAWHEVTLLCIYLDGDKIITEQTSQRTRWET